VLAPGWAVRALADGGARVCLPRHPQTSPPTNSINNGSSNNANKSWTNHMRIVESETCPKLLQRIGGPSIRPATAVLAFIGSQPEIGNNKQSGNRNANGSDRRDPALQQISCGWCA
jgi:hypothetical protein